ncbi:exodeoxyribonuclease VII small subunit [Alysiella crassa]|uniref:Exodeoxyribonuclease 7 small subunit n=1 Tax=Alysiella crassa TaxID=153491 RepID=A0A376BLC2_9NEIS|nr:exodeoxyribonuclease VII small subunit [Alysiella crassa]UOP07266.1 exodeoxyribonuclease VII small subunit [Alysiella crassa]SSY70562.1 Exodeoxyribonuclease 7 small subunit [Alysiella crassa]
MTELSFETALARLEAITQEMQNQALGLDHALALYLEGSELAQFCQRKLADVEQQLHLFDNQQLKELNLDES